MARRNPVTLYFSDEEKAELDEDASRAGMDVTPFVKHVVLTRGKPKVTGGQRKVVDQLERRIEEMQRQIDQHQAEKTQRDALSGLGALPAQKSIDELVAEKWQQFKDQEDLKAYRKLLEDHEALKKKHEAEFAALKQQYDEAEASRSRLASFKEYAPALATGVGQVLVNQFPQFAGQIATTAAALGGTLGALPAPASGPGLSEDDVAALDFARSILDHLEEDASRTTIKLVQTIRELPELLPYLDHTARQVVPALYQARQQAAPPPAPAPQPADPQQAPPPPQAVA